MFRRRRRHCCCTPPAWASCKKNVACFDDEAVQAREEFCVFFPLKAMYGSAFSSKKNTGRTQSSASRLRDEEFRKRRAAEHIRLALTEGLKSDAVDGERKLVV